MSAHAPRVLKGGNLILRKHISLLEIKYFCKLKEPPWAELSPNCVSLFVGYFDKHVGGDAFIFLLNLITSRPKFTRTRSPPDETPTRGASWFVCVENEPPRATGANPTRAMVLSGCRLEGP